MAPKNWSPASVTAMRRPRSVSGSSRPSDSASAARSARADAGVTPGFSRATSRRYAVRRSSLGSDASAPGRSGTSSSPALVQKSGGLAADGSAVICGKKKVGGITPTIVRGRPFMTIACPIARGSAAKALRHSASLRTTVFRSRSPAWKVRPTAAVEPRTSKKFDDTLAPDQRSAVASRPVTAIAMWPMSAAPAIDWARSRMSSARPGARGSR